MDSGQRAYHCGAPVALLIKSKIRMVLKYCSDVVDSGQRAYYCGAATRILRLLLALF